MLNLSYKDKPSFQVRVKNKFNLLRFFMLYKLKHMPNGEWRIKDLIDHHKKG